MLKRFSLTLLAATALGGIATQGASAADILRKAPPPAALPAPVQDWSGIYVGVEGGWGWGHQSFSGNTPFGLSPGDTVCRDLRGRFNGGDCTDSSEFLDFQNDASRIDDPSIPFSGHNQSGGVVGGFFGAQKQWGSWVLGIEASVDYAHITSSNNNGGFTSTNFLTVHNEFTGQPANEGRFTAKSTTIGNFNSTIDTIGAVNAKVGYAFSPQWLFYGTAGMAFAHEKHNFSFSNSLFHLDCDTNDTVGNTNRLVCDVRDPFNFSFAATDGEDGFVRFANQNFAGSGGTTMFGWTAGAGIDFKVPIDAGSAWVFGVDYKHYGFGHHTLSLAGVEGRTFSVDATQDIDVIKGRISYLFSIH